jgi:hypothetical protein
LTEATAPAIAEAIRTLEHRDLDAMGNRGRKWMEADFSAAKMVAQFELLYRRMIAEAAA